jgi:hypothetical protein
MKIIFRDWLKDTAKTCEDKQIAYKAAQLRNAIKYAAAPRAAPMGETTNAPHKLEQWVELYCGYVQLEALRELRNVYESDQNKG